VALLRFIMKHPIFSAFIALSVGGMVALGLLLTFWEDIKMLLSDQFYFSLFLAVAVLGGIQTAVAYFILLERKISAWIQDRFGPNRVGPVGLLQPLADGVKLFLKEDIIPRHVDRALFVFAPFMAMVVALIAFAVIPWGGEFRWPWMAADAEPLVAQVASIHIGVIYILAVGSMGVYGVVLGGWSSNNKFAFYGAMRAAAQMLSYEVPLGLTVIIGVLTAGYLLPGPEATDAMRLEGVVAAQTGGWWLFVYHPVVALMLFIAALAEANRAPFDLAEAEQELIGGFHTEYSGMKWAMFFLGEYAHMITSSAFMACLFFGGFLVPSFLPGAESINTGTEWYWMVVRIHVLALKVVLFIALYMVVRWTLPRFRFDQLMRVAWKALVPAGMLLLALQVLIIQFGWSQWVALVGNVVIFVVMVVASVLVSAGSPITGRQRSMIERDRGGLGANAGLQHAGL